MAIRPLSEDMDIIQGLVIPGIDADLDIIQKLDDEPNDVGGLSPAELKEHFDRAGNILKRYINGNLLPGITDTTAEAEIRAKAEEERIEGEKTRTAAEEGRKAAESAREGAETARDQAESRRAAAESGRQTAETARDQAEAQRAEAESARKTAEAARSQAEEARVAAESERQSGETARTQAEEARAAAEQDRLTGERARQSGEETRKRAEEERLEAETRRLTAEEARETAETARAQAETLRAEEEAVRLAAEEARAQVELLRAAAEALRQAAEEARNVFEAYDGEREYVPGNKVSWQGSSYLCLAPCTGTAPPEGEHWLLIARRGVDGDGSGDMLEAVYDPQGRREDIFAYAEELSRQLSGEIQAAVEAIPEVPATLPASDVYPWAKAAQKPSYTAAEVGAVPTTRKVNGKALSADITLSATDVGARASNWTPTAAQVGAIPTSASCNKNWYWSGQSGQPSWIWGGNDGTNMYVYNPSNFRVAYATSAGGVFGYSTLAALKSAMGLGAACQIVTGTYTGNGNAQQAITLGFRPKAVLVIRRGYQFDALGDNVLAVEGVGSATTSGDMICSITDTGFLAHYESYKQVSLNDKNTKYHYIAFA